MFKVERSVGRLIEVTMRSPVTLDEIDDAGRRMEDALAPLSHPGIICADYTQAKVLMAQESEALGRLFRQFNERLERSALLISPASATHLLQMERVIREAANPSRRAFRDPIELIMWLGEILDSAERDRIHSFFIEHGVSSSPKRRPTV